MNEDQRQQFLIEFGNRIKQLRIERDMSQEELAKRCGYGSRSTINKIELGVNDIPQSKIKAISDALGVPVGVLMGLTDTQNPTPNLLEQIGHQHGKTAGEAFEMYLSLDADDQGEIRGEMKQMLKSEKYSTKDALLNGKII